MKALWLLALAALPAASLTAAPQKKAAVPAVRDWTRTVVATPEGGFRMGNPNAAVKLVEYGSLTCDHCANFSAQAMPTLLGEVRSGKLSFEFRSFVLNAPDLAASILARCGGPADYFRLNSQFFAAQPQWIAKLQQVPKEESAKLAGLPQPQQLQRLAELGGLDALAARAGLAPARAKQCLANPALVARLVRNNQQAEGLGVRATPTFLINGKVAAGVHSWAALQPLLARPGG
jgi:protein-disulfide isomerase